MATPPTNGGQTGQAAGAAAGGAPAAGTQAAAQLNVLAQYIKDLSFENPNAPRSLQPAQQQPNINIQINVSAKPLSETEVEVDLKIEGKAESGSTLLFQFDLVYAGVFRLQNIPQPDQHPIMMIECPRLLFPFAREIISNAVMNSGFPPLRIDPVDFVGLYRQRMAELQSQQQQPTTG
jgi:preprotein translocase subunit SecB